MGGPGMGGPGMGGGPGGGFGMRGGHQPPPPPPHRRGCMGCGSGCMTLMLALGGTVLLVGTLIGMLL